MLDINNKETPEWQQWHHSGVFITPCSHASIVNFEHMIAACPVTCSISGNDIVVYRKHVYRISPDQTNNLMENI